MRFFPPAPTLPNFDRPEVLRRAEALTQSSYKKYVLCQLHGVFRRFQNWCDENGYCALPASAETVALWCTQRSETHSYWTVRTSVSSINTIHRFAGVPAPGKSPLVRQLMEGFRRSRESSERSRPMTVDELRTLAASIRRDRRGLRDRALVLVMFAGALGSYTAAAAIREPLVLSDEGMLLTTTDARRKSISIAAGSHPETCPVEALRDWLAVSSDIQGPLFSSIDAHGRLLKAGIPGFHVNTVLRERAMSKLAFRPLSSLASRFGSDRCEQLQRYAVASYASLNTLAIARVTPAVNNGCAVFAMKPRRFG